MLHHFMVQEEVEKAALMKNLLLSWWFTLRNLFVQLLVMYLKWILKMKCDLRKWEGKSCWWYSCIVCLKLKICIFTTTFLFSCEKLIFMNTWDIYPIGMFEIGWLDAFNTFFPNYFGQRSDIYFQGKIEKRIRHWLP